MLQYVYRKNIKAFFKKQTSKRASGTHYRKQLPLPTFATTNFATLSFENALPTLHKFRNKLFTID